MSTNYFFLPAMNLLGAGCVNELDQIIPARGLKKGLLVSDAGMEAIGMVKSVEDAAERLGLPLAKYTGVVPDPTSENVEEGLAILKAEGCDYLLSVGGGSSHDCAKAIGLVATNGGKIQDYAGINNPAIKFPSLPLITINTTSGTSAELSLGAVISDAESHVKLAIGSPLLMPVISVNDPELMLGMPPLLTAATGFDALTHAIESYLSLLATPVTEACSRKAMELIAENLPTAVRHGDNLEARTNMVYGVFCAGMGLNNALLGNAHSLAHALGAVYGKPHGICCAVALPAVLRYYEGAADDKLTDIAVALGAEAKPEAAAQAIEALCADIDVDRSSVGVKEQDLDQLAKIASEDAMGTTSPKAAGLEEFRTLLHQMR